jgi:hypothetical protein
MAALAPIIPVVQSVGSAIATAYAAVKPVIAVVGGAMTVKSAYDTVTGKTKSGGGHVMNDIRAINSNQVQEGFQNYMAHLSRTAPGYVARHKPEFKETFYSYANRTKAE